MKPNRTPTAAPAKLEPLTPPDFYTADPMSGNLRRLNRKAGLSLGLCLLLAACATSPTSGVPVVSPQPPPQVFPASITARIDPEPDLPAGVDPSALPPEWHEFLTAEYLPWARGVAQRLNQIQQWAIKRASAANPSPR